MATLALPAQVASSPNSDQNAKQMANEKLVDHS